MVPGLISFFRDGIGPFKSSVDKLNCSVPDVVGKFSLYDPDNKGSITVDQACEGLGSLTKDNGPDLEQKEWDFFLKTAAIENESVPLAKFIDLYARLKQFKRQKAK